MPSSFIISHSSRLFIVKISNMLSVPVNLYMRPPFTSR